MFSSLPSSLSFRAFPSRTFLELRNSLSLIIDSGYNFTLSVAPRLLAWLWVNRARSLRRFLCEPLHKTATMFYQGLHWHSYASKFFSFPLSGAHFAKTFFHCSVLFSVFSFSLSSFSSSILSSSTIPKRDAIVTNKQKFLHLDSWSLLTFKGGNSNL